MRFGQWIGALVIVSVMACGCATSLNSMQKAEMRAYQAKGLEVREKNPTTGALLGFLPGFGSFYAREPGLGIVNFLLWPASVLWDPISGYQGSETINYYATKAALERKMRKELKQLEDELAVGGITREEYLRKKRNVEESYSPDL